MGVKAWALLLFLCSFTSVYAQVIINEVMYAPIICSQSYCEWVELYNGGTVSVSLENWTICGNKLLKGYISNRTGLTYLNTSFELPPNNYAMITDGGSGTLVYDYFNVSNNSLAFSINANSICGGLADTKGFIEINNSNKIRIDSLNYTSAMGGNKTGNTLCLYNNSWQECLATPGRANEINLSIPTNNTNSTNTTLPNLVIIRDFPTEIYTKVSYKDIFNLSIQNKKPCTPYDNVTVEYNITSPNFFEQKTFTREVGCSSSVGTGSFILNDSGDYVLCGNIVNSSVKESNFSDNSVCFNLTVIDVSSVSCDIDLTIDLNDSILYQQGESISYDFILNNETYPFIIEYWIEDLFGRMVKSKYNTTNTYSKTWKADISEEDRVLLLKGKLYPLCKDIDINNNHVEKRFIVTNKDAFQIINSTNVTNSTNSSYVLIKKVTPTDPGWGDALKVDLEVYKNNTAKYALSAWVERNGRQVSEVTKVSLKEKNILYGLTLPIQLDQDCVEDDEEVILVVEGLDQHEEYDLTIQGSSSCEENTPSSSSKSESSSSKESASVTNEDIRYELLGVPDRVNPGDTLNFKLKIQNDEWDHFFQMYSYVYRGSRCYSCTQETLEREDTLQEILLGYDQEGEVSFSLPLDADMKDGEYKLKIKVHKDGQITGQGVDANIMVGEVKKKNVEEGSLDTASTSDSEKPALSSQRVILNQSKFLVYESNSEKAKHWIPYLLILVLGLLCVILIKKR